jgi:hypothetical protein
LVADATGTTGLALVTAKLLLTVVAAAKLALPTWLALTVQVPALTSVKVLPLTVHTGRVVDVNVTGKPELDVAVKVAGVPTVCAPGDAKVMVWAGSTTPVTAATEKL